MLGTLLSHKQYYINIEFDHTHIYIYINFNNITHYII